MRRALFLPVIAMLALVACAEPPGDIERRGDNPSSEVWGVRVFEDPKTGCEYLTLYGHGITPRLAPDGKPDCTDVRAAIDRLNTASKAAAR